MKRGEVWTAAGGPDYAGKPRPVLILQNDLYEATASVTTCGFTSDPTPMDFVRPLLPTTHANRLLQPSRVMVDKVMTIPRSRLGQRIGRFDAEAMGAVDEALLVFLGLV